MNVPAYAELALQMSILNTEKFTYIIPSVY